MGNETKSVGGFFDAKGRLIQEPLATKGKNLKAKADRKAESESLEQENDKSLKNALSSVRLRTNAQLEGAISKNDSVQSDLKRAKEIVKQQQAVIKDLQSETSSDNANQEKISRLQKEYKSLEKERADLASEVERNNRSRLENGSQAVQVGNRQIANFRPVKVEFEASEANLTSEQGLRAAKRELREAAQSINTQLKANKGQREEIGQALNQARSEIRKVERENDFTRSEISSIEEAAFLAEETSKQILNLGKEAVSFASKTLTADSVASLIQP